MNEVNDEVCNCNHSKGYHRHLSMDSHGGVCEKCPCEKYVLNRIVTYKDYSEYGNIPLE